MPSGQLATTVNLFFVLAVLACILASENESHQLSDVGWQVPVRHRRMLEGENAAENSAKYRRQALDLAVNRLHILESLDGQLREFASRSASVRRELCSLRPFDERATNGGCLFEARLSRQVPPYMLNLNRRLRAESSSPAGAVHLMPYQSQVVRSFRQPALTSVSGRQVGQDEEADVVVELSAKGDNFGERKSRSYLEPRDEIGQAACNLSERALPAGARRQLCFWFRIGKRLGAQLARERLVEAELHVFKLPPELLLAGAQQDWSYLRNGRQLSANVSGAGQPRLRTNLLEVSLYQILPGKREPTNATWSSQLAADFPLRLLDIRRMDLHSSGWETFYAKRALDDWVREPNSNLGLVIKAKSMFDEPVGIGLIRFADAYDHRRAKRGHNNNSEQSSRAMNVARAPRRSSANETHFDSSHQPILVIYTTDAQ